MSDSIPIDAEWLPRSMDYLGNIRERLGDLAGFGTLANELIQNAEDAEASRIVFDVSDMALTVDNDAKFTDCGQVERHRNCPLKAVGKPSCDWHNLTWIAAGQKRDREETIGKFGVGFLSVYQVTDYPEVMSGRHWVLHEDSADGDMRIRRPCRDKGCDPCRDVTGTRLVLPFATDPKSYLRKALGQEAITWKELPALTTALTQAAPQALLFMRHVHQVEVRRNGKAVATVERVASEEGSATTVVISGTNVDETWFILEGDFKERADVRKGEQGDDRIERVRHARVRVAVPASGSVDGLLFAGLPTATSTRLPFHIDSSFFPSTDRKRIILDPGNYRTTWNETALAAAAAVLTRHILWLKDQLHAVGIWTLFHGVNRARNASRAVDIPDVGGFWAGIVSCFHDSPIAWRQDGSWSNVGEAPVLVKEEEFAAVQVLASLGIIPMHESLRIIVSDGLISNELGTRRLTLEAVVAALDRARLTGTMQRANVPRYMATDRGLRELWVELALLVPAAGAATVNAMLQRAIAPTESGTLLLPLPMAYLGDTQTRRIARHLDGIPLLAESFERESTELLRHCRTVDADRMVTGLEQTGAHEIAVRYADGRYDPSDLLDWLGLHLRELERDPSLVERLRRIAAFPTVSGLAPLRELSMPGDFPDPLGFSAVITLPDLARHRATLEALRVNRLTIGDFVRSHVTRAFAESRPGPEVTRKVVKVLTDRVRDLEGDTDARDALRDLPLIECVDGSFRKPSDAVQASETADAVLGATGTVALRPADAPRRREDLWILLGLPALPTPEQVEKRVLDVTSSDMPRFEQIHALERICLYLARQRNDPAFLDLIGRLKELRWLPARGDGEHWHTPPTLFATFQDYLFETQGRFVELSRAVQNQLVPLFDLLGVRSVPPTSMVVDHLLACAEAGRPVNTQVWEALAQRADDPALQKLRNTPCLLVGDRYVEPNHVFWGGSNLGGRLVTLSSDMQRYRPFFDAIGVRERASANDAATVLREIAAELSDSTGTQVTEVVASAMRACWQLLSEELASDDIDVAVTISGLHDTPSFMDRSSRPCSPDRLYIEDRPQLRDLFPDAVRSRVVEFDPSLSPALAVAGARHFSDAVRIVRLDGNPERPATSLASRLNERWTSIRRVVASADADLDPPVRLSDFECVAVTEPVIRYELHSEPKHPMTDEQRPDAVFISHERRLYVRDRVDIPWLDCARELSIAVGGPRQVAKIAPGISVVLGTSTADEAEAALDILGIARVLERATVSVADNGETVLGGTELSADVQDGPEDRGSSTVGFDESSVKRGSDSHGTSRDGQSGGQTNQGSRGNQTPGSQKPESPAGSGKAGPHGQAKPRPWAASPEASLPIWLPAPRETERVPDPEGAARIVQVDRDGVARALRYERESGREPEEMAHGNPGFDIRSRVDGEVVRYIEVKAIGGPWRDLRRGLSGPQHDAAVKHGTSYWLYVVENAGGPAEELHPIQDPIGRATLFAFDPTWAKVAWDDDGPFDDLDPEQPS